MFKNLRTKDRRIRRVGDRELTSIIKVGNILVARVAWNTDLKAMIVVTRGKEGLIRHRAATYIQQWTPREKGGQASELILKSCPR